MLTEIKFFNWTKSSSILFAWQLVWYAINNVCQTQIFKQIFQ